MELLRPRCVRLAGHGRRPRPVTPASAVEWRVPGGVNNAGPARLLGRGPVTPRLLPAGACQLAATAARGAGAVAVSARRSTRRVRTRNPLPTSSRAAPMTIAKVATLSAKNEVFRAVVSAVSVTQMLRAPFSTGLPDLGSVAAAFSSLVGVPAAVR